MWAQLFQTRVVFSNHLWLEAAAILSDVGHDDDVVVDARLNFYLSESEKVEKTVWEKLVPFLFVVVKLIFLVLTTFFYYLESRFDPKNMSVTP